MKQDHTQIIFTSLRTDNHASTLSLNFYWPDALPKSQQGITVHERLLRPYLRHCSSAAPAVRWLPSAAYATTPPFDVWSSGLFSVASPAAWNLLPYYLRDPTRSVDSFHRDLKTFLVLLAYTAHQGLCDYALYNGSTCQDIDIDNQQCQSTEGTEDLRQNKCCLIPKTLTHVTTFRCSVYLYNRNICI